MYIHDSRYMIYVYICLEYIYIYLYNNNRIIHQHDRNSLRRSVMVRYDYNGDMDKTNSTSAKVQISTSHTGRVFRDSFLSG